MEEIWKPFRDGTYQISNLRNIRNIKTGKLKTPSKSDNGYLIFGHFSNGKRLNVLVHRAVMECFQGRCPEGYEVNHKDGDKLNNRVSTLEYVNRSENLIHATTTGLNQLPTSKARGENHWTYLHPESIARGNRNGSRTKSESLVRGEKVKASKLKPEEVVQIRKLSKQGVTQIELAQLFPVTRRNINSIINNKSWRHLA